MARSKIIGFAIVVLSLTGTVLALEAIVRVWEVLDRSNSAGAEYIESHFVAHPYFGFTLRSKTKSVMPLDTKYESDRYGFRNDMGRELKTAKSERLKHRRFHVGIFGGSAAFGIGVAENGKTLGGRLEPKLQALAGDKTVHVYNLAMPAWHYPQQFFLLSQVAEYLDLIITFDGFNEIYIPILNRKLEADVGYPPDYPLINYQSPLYRFTALFDACGSTEHGFHLVNWMKISACRMLTRKMMSRLGEGLAQTVQLSSEPVGKEQPPEEFGLNEHLRYSKLMNAVAREHGVPVVHVIQPFTFADKSLSRSEYGRLCELDWCQGIESHIFSLKKGPAAVFSELHENLSRELSSKTSRILNYSVLLPNEKRYWLDIIHPTSEGTELVASKLAADFESSRLLARPK